MDEYKMVTKIMECVQCGEYFKCIDAQPDCGILNKKSNIILCLCNKCDGDKVKCFQLKLDKDSPELIATLL